MANFNLFLEELPQDAPAIVTPSPLVYPTSHNTTTPLKRPVFEQKSQSSKIQSGPVFIPHVSVNPKYIAFYDVPAEGRHTRTAAQMEAARFLRENSTDGVISQKAGSRINKIVSWFCALAKDKQSEYEKRKLSYRLTFATLTLPAKQMHDDKFIKRNLLNRFLITVERSHDVTNYFWRAEAQENGNIHFHIILDKFIHWQELRRTWNDILKDYGYIDTYQAKMKEFFKDGFRMSENKNDKRTEAQQRIAYEKGKESNFTNPNSTDIHNLKFVRNIAAYISKYCAKNNRYFEVETSDVKEVVMQIKKMKDSFDVKVREGKIVFCTKRTEENKFQKIEEILTEAGIQFTSAREKVIRDIEGRLWFASKSVLNMKNFISVVTSEINMALQYIVASGKGKWVAVSDYCRLFMCDIFNTEFEEENVKGLFDLLIEHCRQQQFTLN